MALNANKVEAAKETDSSKPEPDHEKRYINHLVHELHRSLDIELHNCQCTLLEIR